MLMGEGQVWETTERLCISISNVCRSSRITFVLHAPPASEPMHGHHCTVYGTH